jgi:hypothetical protein
MEHQNKNRTNGYKKYELDKLNTGDKNDGILDSVIGSVARESKLPKR